MTSTLTDLSVPDIQVGVFEPDVLPEKPKRDEVVAAIMSEAGVDEDTASAFIYWLERVIGIIRAYDDYHRYYLLYWEWEAHHHVIELIAPDNQEARPGTAHDFTQRYMLDPAEGELGWLHCNSGDGEPENCNVQIRIIIARVVA